jgi:hypothetical protein
MEKRRHRTPSSDMWDDVIRVQQPEQSNPEVQCRYCDRVWYSKSLERLQRHMEGCTRLPNALWGRYSRGNCAPKKQRLQSTLDYEEYLLPLVEQRELDRLLAEAIYGSGVAFSFVSIS